MMETMMKRKRLTREQKIEAGIRLNNPLAEMVKTMRKQVIQPKKRYKRKKLIDDQEN